MVGRRRKLLRYLNNEDVGRYRAIISQARTEKIAPLAALSSFLLPSSPAPSRPREDKDPMLSSYECTIGSKTLSIESGKLALQANGSITIRYGDCLLLVTATMASPREGLDFLPLTIDFEERLYARGKISGQLLPPRGQAQHRRHPDRPADRQAAAAPVPQGLQKRGPDHCHPLLSGPGESGGRADRDRGVDGAGDFGHTVRRPHRRDADGATWTASSW